VPLAAPQAEDQAAKPLEFDVVSIRQNKTASNTMWDKTPPDGFAYEHMPLKYVISDAYGVRQDLISGEPSWVETDFYDIVAKIAGPDLPAFHNLTKQQRGQMLQSVLADRCKLATHTVTKELPSYELIVAKNGPKLKEAKPGAQLSYGANFGDINAEATSTSNLADMLSRQLQQTVVDKTGLTGKYDFELKWAADLKAGPSPAAADGPSDPSSGPSLFTALQEQLGLKLQPAKVPIETLVIDHIEPPSPN
jgi:uncharacterized protein (TIGR03435 family)